MKSVRNHLTEHVQTQLCLSAYVGLSVCLYLSSVSISLSVCLSVSHAVLTNSPRGRGLSVNRLPVYSNSVVK